MRAQGQARWNGATKTCVLQPTDPAETDVDRWNHSECFNGDKNVLVEFILASVFANGLSRYGSRHAFNSSSMKSRDNPFRWELKTPPKASDYYASLLSINPSHDAVLPPPANSNYVKLRMRIAVVGYAWYASGVSDYLATAVVLIYMLMALAHTIWVVTKGVTSSSWDTVTELLALALRSPESDALRGSGAGIERLGTYGRLTKLRAIKDGQGERLFLIVDGEQIPRVGHKYVDIDSEYS